MPQRSPGRYSRLHTATPQATAQRRRDLDPLPAPDHAPLSSALPGSHHTHRDGVDSDKCASLDRGRLRPGSFRPLPPPIPQAFLPLEKTVLPPERIDALLRERAEQYDWTIDHMDRDFLSHTPIPHGGAPRGVNRSSSRTTAAASGSTASMTSASAVRSSRSDIPAGTSAG